MIKNVIFDIGGVLVDWDPDRSFRECGADDAAIQKIREKMFAPGVWLEEDLSIMQEEELSAFLKEKCEGYEREIEYLRNNFHTSVCQYPDTKEWIDHVHERGRKVYILSNFGKHCFEQVIDTHMDFLQMTDGAVISYREHKVKPDDDIYETLLDRYALKAKECVFLDDLKDNLVTAERLGFKTILVRDRAAARRELDNLLEISDSDEFENLH